MRLTDRIAAAAARLHGLPGFPLIETGRLLMRAPADEDRLPVFALFSNPEAMRYWSRPPMRHIDEAAAWIANSRSLFANREAIGWIISATDGGEALGTCTLYDIQLQHLRAGIGYALLPSAQGQGIASEAVQTICAWAFQFLDLHRIEADIHPDNAASRRVLLRCGFRSEGLLRQRFVAGEEIQDSEVLGRLADEA